MNDRKTVPMSHSLAVQESIVLPGDTNAHDTIVWRVADEAHRRNGRHFRAATLPRIGRHGVE